MHEDGQCRYCEYYGSSGRPSTRVVGIKGFDKSGFKIATNGNSAKAKELVKYQLSNLYTMSKKKINSSLFCT